MTSSTVSLKGDSRAAKVEKLRRQARSNLTTYKRAMYRRYLHAAHLDAIDRALEQVTRYVETGGREGIGRLIIEMPPRHGKTKTVSQFYPTWHLGRNPDHRVMLVSYGASLAFKNSRAARNVIRSPRYRAIFGHALSRESSAVDSWSFEENEANEGSPGGAEALGIEGGATGKGAHVLILDDLIKNREMAESDGQREKIWDAFKDDLETRLEPGGAIIIVNTRWHLDDVTGRALQEGGWHRIRLPAIAETDDPLGRQPGEALWPERYPIEVLLQIRATRTPYSWLSIFQQSPISREGGLFKYDLINRYRVDRLPVLLRRIKIAVDPAVSSKKTSDETGMIAGGLGVDGHAYILHDVSGRYSPLAWAKLAVKLNRRLQGDGIVAEKNNGGELVESNIRVVDKTVPITLVHASRGKWIRAEPVASLYQLGMVHHVGGHFEDLEEQMCTWREGDESPDRLDALVWLLTELLLGEHAGEMQEQPKQDSVFRDLGDAWDYEEGGGSRWRIG